MEKIEIKVFYTAFLQLSLKYLFDFGEVIRIITRKLGGQIIALSGVFAQQFSQHSLRVSAMITPGSIEKVDAMLHGVIYHLLGCLHIDLAVISFHHRQAHCTQTQCGKVQVLKGIVYQYTHSISVYIVYILLHTLKKGNSFAMANLDKTL
jgi:hypothetical protein